HPKANVDFYPTLMRQFNKTFTRLAPIFSMSPGCRRKFRDINCELLRGSICSMMFRIYTTTQQQCGNTMRN
ncbi:Hypothetical predicted protein, partial [Paramuricea clavata]